MFIPPLHALKLIYVLPILVQGSVQVSGTIPSFEDCYKASVAGGVWVADIHNLHVHLEASMPLVPSQLHPHLAGWDGAIMPSEATGSSISQEKEIIC